ncbi:hypothetical protein BDF20DRAFT_909509 [Mycotypha africana]|uniref:uncharacterized protein n=1 Tax=Mycotypha africana TaxID=64632 RepID=UPI0022FFDFE0|nr:uncharacterized protein BDF20DRAFT_909509 [Mycotypha africana]KAI8991780.1 hypothetical protein BDF20DRAFT_909509 [Mycotypha africana]
MATDSSNGSRILSIETLPGKGRAYVATKDITAGTVIHIAEPLATAVSQEWIPETCMWCFDFGYPKKQKVKIVDTPIEMQALYQEWEQYKNQEHCRISKRNVKKEDMRIYKNMLFCSETCREKFKKSGDHSNNPSLMEWKLILAMNMKLDQEYKDTMKIEPNLITTAASTTTMTCQPLEGNDQWIDANDDSLLLAWLDTAWSCLTKDSGIYKEIDDADRTMCRLIAACIIKKYVEEETSNKAQLQNMSLGFKDLLLIQDNELSFFRSCFPKTLQRLPPLTQLDSASRKSLLLSFLPIEIKDVMALYCFFQRALSNSSLENIPALKNVDHPLFRTIYFREKANSFGLWELSDRGQDIDNGGVTDDLELLGWGIYPSAVYFNHSCDANVKKVRDGRNIKFIARRPIEQGEEACISYGSIEESVNERRSRLLEHYYFLCQCTRCLKETISEPQ